MHGLYGALTDSRRIRVRGQVQGVGFRPFVWHLARSAGLRGDVRNDAEGVLIHATGPGLDAFERAISAKAPPLARVDAVESEPFSFAQAPTDFAIVASGPAGAETSVPPDAATCPDCIADIRGTDPRRAGYAFTNCTHCGPRLSILRALPYDRAQTSMAGFGMCADCTREYTDPEDRRFHAQPVACARCGPRLWLEIDGKEQTVDPVSAAAERLKSGQILAVKGLGGFHLACDATNAAAVDSLRARKRRPTKPFALMGTLEHVTTYGAPTQRARTRLTDPAAPIVLIERGPATLPEVIAPGQATLGWMLPYTPLHHLLLDAVDRPLVMTSGNLSGEPQAIGNSEARQKLSTFADTMILHDRDIERRLDDSVERETPHGPMILRRARGRVPGTISLPGGFEDAPQTVAFGAHLKSAICLIKNGEALLSHHLGDLDDALSCDEFEKADKDYAALFDHAPSVFACDLHPGYRSSRHAAARARDGVLIEVQHHHAHLAACLADNGWERLAGPVAGIVLDGLGLGDDGSIWGGEILLGDYAGYTRVAHLKPAPLPGGDAAAREPWRNLLARLDQAGMSEQANRLLAGHPVDALRHATDTGLNAPLSSSAGRLFDAFAAALGICADAQSFEGEAAMTLEAMALDADAGFDDPYAFGPDLDPAPLFQGWADDLTSGVAAPIMAARFHAGVAHAFCAPARALVERGKARSVALSGGCFQNATLLSLCCAQLHDVPTLIHTRTPANDGGLALGQALIAAAAQSP